MKASDHNHFPQSSLARPFPALSNSRNGAEGRKFKEWEVEGKRLIKMISNLFLLSVLNQAISFDSLLNQLNYHCVYYECNTINTGKQEGS